MIHVEVSSMSRRLRGDRGRVGLEIQELEIVSSLIPLIAIVVHTRTRLSFELGIRCEPLRSTEVQIVGKFVLQDRLCD